MALQSQLPNKIVLQKTYESYRPIFNQILIKVEESLRKNIKISSQPTYKARIKSFKSYYKKVLRQKPKEVASCNGLVTLTDMIGIRIICPFLEDLEVVEQQLSKVYDVKEVEKKGAQQSFREFGYESVHVLIAIPKDCLPDDIGGLVIPEETVCEIQLRTILQDAWAEVEHELIYKSEFNPFDKPLRRKLASINASLSLADTIFQEIRDYQNKLQSELGFRRSTFYNKADELTDEELGLSHQVGKAPFAYAATNTSDRSSIDDLVLAALHEHNSSNFAKAIEIYTRILDSKPTPPPVVLGVIFKHRGMAYFAQGEYESALEDFKSSSANDPKAFRSIYYEGIVYSVQGKDKESIESFNKSLEIDSYQSHVYYRRAIAYFNLSMYKEALADIASAENLGLADDEDLKALKKKLVNKFDMGV